MSQGGVRAVERCRSAPRRGLFRPVSYVGSVLLALVGLMIIIFSGKIGGPKKRGALGGPALAQPSLIALGLFLVACGNRLRREREQIGQLRTKTADEGVATATAPGGGCSDASSRHGRPGGARLFGLAWRFVVSGRRRDSAVRSRVALPFEPSGWGRRSRSAGGGRAGRDRTPGSRSVCMPGSRWRGRRCAELVGLGRRTAGSAPRLPSGRGSGRAAALTTSARPGFVRWVPRTSASKTSSDRMTLRSSVAVTPPTSARMASARSRLPASASTSASTSTHATVEAPSRHFVVSSGGRHPNDRSSTASTVTQTRCRLPIRRLRARRAGLVVGDYGALGKGRTRAAH